MQTGTEGTVHKYVGGYKGNNSVSCGIVCVWVCGGHSWRGLSFSLEAVATTEELLTEEERGWTQSDGSMVRSTCSCREHPYGVSQHPQLQFRDHMPSFDLCGYQAPRWCISIHAGKTLIHTNITTTLKYFFKKREGGLER